MFSLLSQISCFTLLYFFYKAFILLTLGMKSSDPPALCLSPPLHWTVTRLSLVTRSLLIQGSSKNTAVMEKGFKTGHLVSPK